MMRDSRSLRDRYLAGLSNAASGKLPAPTTTRNSLPAASGEKQDILSVTSLNRLAKSLLETNFPAVTVEGEISNLAKPASGHWYFSLKDDRAQLRCAMFANRNRLLRLRPENGQQVILRGRLSIYEGRGDYQLICDSMELAGDGALQRAFEELKQKLQSEGLFDDANKQPLPVFPIRVGVVTSASGAAIRDIISVFQRRFPALELVLFPASVQGAPAAEEIASAIAQAVNYSDNHQHLDALIVGRGGGSLEDLQAFNTEVVARAVHHCPLPTVSAVGHEIDFTICDFVADLRAPTPSAAAELLSPSQDELMETLRGIELRLGRRMFDELNQLNQRVDSARRQLMHPGQRLQQIAQALAGWQRRAAINLRQSLRERQLQLAQLNRALQGNSPRTQLRQQTQSLHGQQQRLHRAMDRIMAQEGSRLASLARNLNAVSPLQTLSRGYSITLDEQGSVLRSVAGVSAGQTLVSRLADGEIHSRVEATSPAQDAEKPSKA
jgi:exodeoxyribonuclease VII large subunit